MSAPSGKPRQYVRPIPWTWWLKRPAYTKFMVRELTSVFIAAYTIFLLVLACSARDAAAFQRLFAVLRSPVSVLLHLVVLFFALFHTITFFNLTPRAIVVRVGEERVPEDAIALAHYAGWLVLSILLIFIAVVS